MKWNYLLTLFCLLLTACNEVTTVTIQPTVTSLATDTALPSPTPVLPTATFYPTATQEIPPTLPAPPNARAKYFMSIGQPLKLLTIRMIDEQNGWAIDAGNSNGLNHILRTQDGGHSWRDVTPYYGYGHHIYFADGFFALDANTAWATTPQMPACDIQNWSCIRIPDTALMWHTTDGGRTWQGQFIAAVPIGSIPMSIQFLDAHTGWLLAMSFDGGGRQYHLYQTADGGTHWSEIMDVSSHTAPEYLREKDITAITFQDSQTGWMSISEICCNPHLITEWSIYRSTDAGTTWDKFSLSAPDPLPETFSHNTAQCAVQDLQVILPNVLDTTFFCYVYEGLSKPEYYFHYHSGDGGKHWISFQKTGDVQFIDAMLGWRMGPNEGAYDIERTQDGGITWTRLKTVQWSGSLHFVNKFVGWALAASSDGTTLLHTVDGGRTWEELKPVVSGQ